MSLSTNQNTDPYNPITNLNLVPKQYSLDSISLIQNVKNWFLIYMNIKIIVFIIEI